MNDTILTVNQVILDRNDNSSFRILYISPDPLEAYWISLTSSRQVPVSMPVADVNEGINSGRYALIGDIFANRNPNPGETAIKRRDQAWALISDLVVKEPSIYRFKERSLLLKEASERTGARIPNIYKYLAKYWKGGMTPDALLPFYENCGRTGSPYDSTYKRRGRKKIKGAEGKVLTNEDIRHFTDAILSWYMGKEQLSLEKTYKKMLNEYYVTKDENGSPIKLDPDLIPSRAQFLYWHRKNKDVLGEDKARRGERNYPLKSRSSIEKTETYGILFKGLYYGCEQGFREHWFDSARIVGRETISVSFDPRDASFIYFQPAHNSEPVECYLLDSNKIDGHFTTEEMEQLQHAEHEEREIYRPTEDFQNILTDRKIREIISNSEAQFPKKLDKSTNKHLSEIKANRKAEIENQHQHGTEDPNSGSDDTSDTSTPGKSPIQKMLEEALDELY